MSTLENGSICHVLHNSHGEVLFSKDITVEQSCPITGSGDDGALSNRGSGGLQYV